jgi:hypothetical protein
MLPASKLPYLYGPRISTGSIPLWAPDKRDGPRISTTSFDMIAKKNLASRALAPEQAEENAGTSNAHWSVGSGSQAGSTSESTSDELDVRSSSGQPPMCSDSQSGGELPAGGLDEEGALTRHSKSTILLLNDALPGSVCLQN